MRSVQIQRHENDQGISRRIFPAEDIDAELLQIVNGSPRQLISRLLDASDESDGRASKFHSVDGMLHQTHSRESGTSGDAHVTVEIHA